MSSSGRAQAVAGFVRLRNKYGKIRPVRAADVKMWEISPILSFWLLPCGNTVQEYGNAAKCSARLVLPHQSTCQQASK
jgi:hypothetical protein